MASSISILSPPSPCLARSLSTCSSTPMASLSLQSGSRTRTSSVSLNAAADNKIGSGLLHSGFVSCSTLSCLSSSSFSGLSLRFNLNSSVGLREGGNKCRGFVVRAGKAALCLTKRNRSRKSLARTHGFRRRMRTTGGRAILKRRRAKGRWVLCPKSYPSSGKFC